VSNQFLGDIISPYSRQELLKCFLSQKFQQLDPFHLQKQLASKIKYIIKNVKKYNEKNLNQI